MRRIRATVLIPPIRGGVKPLRPQLLASPMSNGLSPPLRVRSTGTRRGQGSEGRSLGCGWRVAKHAVEGIHEARQVGLGFPHVGEVVFAVPDLDAVAVADECNFSIERGLREGVWIFTVFHQAIGYHDAALLVGFEFEGHGKEETPRLGDLGPGQQAGADVAGKCFKCFLRHELQIAVLLDEIEPGAVDFGVHLVAQGTGDGQAAFIVDEVIKTAREDHAKTSQ